MTIDVSEDKLASVLVLESKRGLESCQYPEPYRGHNENELVVKFSEYKKFIAHYLVLEDYLATNSVKLRSWVDHNNEELLIRSFYLDMARAIAKEISFANNNRPTRITHKIDSAVDMSSDFVSNVWDMFPHDMKRAHDKLLASMRSEGYVYPPESLEQSIDEISYASVLYAMALGFGKVPYMPWSLART